MNIINLASKHKCRKNLVYVLLIFICIIIAILLFKEPSTPSGIPNDFVAFWSAGHLIASQENPYSLENILSLNPELEFDVLVRAQFFNPPTILLLFIPFGLLPFHLSKNIWLLLSVILLIISTLWIWRIYKGPLSKRWIAILCILTFTPAFFALFEGQVTFIILLGITGFLFFAEQRKWFTAGVFLSLLTIKYQLVLPFLITVILWIIYERRWKVIMGAVLVSLISLLIVTIIKPSIIIDYLFFLTHLAPSPCDQPVLAALFCVLGGERIDWLSYIPTTVGIIWLVIIWWRNKDKWSWRERISLFIIISILTAPYAWMHDELLFLIPVLEVAIVILNIRQNITSYFIIVAYLLMNVIAFILIPTLRYHQLLLLWMPTLFLGIYILAKVKLFPIWNEQ
jgi:hypothetical protein